MFVPKEAAKKRDDTSWCHLFDLVFERPLVSKQDI
jgi:hypothetical protein